MTRPFVEVIVWAGVIVPGAVTGGAYVNSFHHLLSASAATGLSACVHPTRVKKRRVMVFKVPVYRPPPVDQSVLVGVNLFPAAKAPADFCVSRVSLTKANFERTHHDG